jgi:hypothetical protein
MEAHGAYAPNSADPPWRPMETRLSCPLVCNYLVCPSTTHLLLSFVFVAGSFAQGGTLAQRKLGQLQLFSLAFDHSTLWLVLESLHDRVRCSHRDQAQSFLEVLRLPGQYVSIFRHSPSRRGCTNHRHRPIILHASIPSKAAAYTGRWTYFQNARQRCSSTFREHKRAAVYSNGTPQRQIRPRPLWIGETGTASTSKVSQRGRLCGRQQSTERLPMAGNPRQHVHVDQQRAVQCSAAWQAANPPGSHRHIRLAIIHACGSWHC